MSDIDVDIDMSGPYSSSSYAGERSTRSRRRGFCTRRRMILGTIVVLLVAIGAVVGVLLVGGGGGGGGSDSHIEDAPLYNLLESTMVSEGISTEGMAEDRSSYKYKAYQWLARNEGRNSYERAQLVQRFALACLYYATYQVPTVYATEPPTWASEDNWLSDNHECQWGGISCNTRLRVSGISLENNQLSGSLPEETSLLRETLTTIDLTTNTIYMEQEQMDWFGKLTLVETMLLDDNFLSTNDGLPSSLVSLTALQKLRLSYNLLGGTLDGSMFSQLQALTHLEIESNYLSGVIPTELGSMPNLVYLYMRRNALEGNLDFLKQQPQGGLPELFALWLDANEFINGTIPTELGLFDGLASISLTNNTLSGPIPTELGNIGGLRRLWLYNNELTGTVPTELAQLEILEIFEIQDNEIGGIMPSGVCTNVLAATYDRKSLAADCAEVACGCCTECP